MYDDTTNDDDTNEKLLHSVDDLFDDAVPWQQQQQQQSAKKRPRVHWDTPKLVLLRRPAPSSVAESRLREHLATKPANTRHLSVLIPLYGAVDLGTVLKKTNFDRVESVTFAPGGITRLLGVPDSVVRLECSENELDAAALLDLGHRLQILVASRNRIAGDVCVAHLASLRHLNLEHNAVEQFIPERGDQDDDRDDDAKEEDGDAKEQEDDTNLFPSALETLLVSHNRLQGLNLQSCPGLRRLEARFNALPFVLVNAPQTLTGPLLLLPDGAVVKHAPTVPILSSSVSSSVLLPEGVVRHTHTFLEKGSTTGGADPSSSSSSSTEQLAALLPPMQMPADYRQNVERFFSEKAAYDAHVVRERKKRKPTDDTATTTCPHCQRPGGMLFSGKDQKYTAQCLSADPATCPFRPITVNRGCFVSLRAHATRLRQRVIAARESMIKLQYDALLGYLPADGLAKRFPDQVARYNGLVTQFETFQRRAEECFFSTVRAERRKEMRREMDVLVAEVRELLANDHWAEAARLQSGELLALSNRLSKETYPGRGFLIEYERPETKEGVVAFEVLPDVHARADTQFNVGVPL